MIIRIIGASFILLGCGSFGVMICANVKNEIKLLQNFLHAMEYMECELRYRMTPLPDLCRNTTMVTKGPVSRIFESLGKMLELQVSARVSACMTATLKKHHMIPDNIMKLFEDLGDRLGVFDLDGQLRALSSLRKEAEDLLIRCREGQENRIRSYKTISLCAGAAIIILLI